MKNNILSITWLHAVACLLIVLCNAEGFVRELSVDKFSGLSGYGTAMGQLGVFMFFMTSGYLTASLHWRDFGEGRVANFIKGRLIKLLPVYYLFTLVTIIFWIINPDWFPSISLTPADNLLSLIFIPSVFSQELNSLTPVLSVGWIFCYEILFYAIFSIGLLFARRSGLTWIFLSMLVLAAASQTLHYDNLWFRFYTNPIILYFLSGVFCFALQPRLSIPWYHNRYSLFTVSLLIIMATAYLQGIAQLMVLTIAFFLLTFFSFNTRKASHTGRTLTAIGLASYSIYACHVLLMGGLKKALTFFTPEGSGNVTMFMSVAVLTLCSVALGYLIYRLVERRASFMLWTKVR
ncbi:acyltransferase [Erwinia sp. E_sp_B04_7]|uniref:acyltransferase family protein n=1 Tax=unclassified Erwinia TaxID=2622719 RepID=UPI0030D5031E